MRELAEAWYFKSIFDPQEETETNFEFTVENIFYTGSSYSSTLVREMQFFALPLTAI